MTRVARAGHMQKVTPEQKPRGSEGVGHVHLRCKNAPGRGWSKCKWSVV